MALTAKGSSSRNVFTMIPLASERRVQNHNISQYAGSSLSNMGSGMCTAFSSVDSHGGSGLHCGSTKEVYDEGFDGVGVGDLGEGVCDIGGVAFEKVEKIGGEGCGGGGWWGVGKAMEGDGGDVFGKFHPDIMWPMPGAGYRTVVSCCIFG
ncbi:hypothetical protein VNO77_25785 [Canavalia gladiata]|uniref:Uncharacterized protein n=1 Tax=Canavalia gladiata TaxID=3824 RepID=A0AAN9KT62_CANGL